MRICQRTDITIFPLRLCQVEGWRILAFPCAKLLFGRAVCCAILIDSAAELLSQDGSEQKTKLLIRLCLSGTGMDGICFSSFKGSGFAHDKIFAENTLRP